MPKRLTPLGVAVLYAVFATLWIIASGKLLIFVVDDAVLQGHIELAKGLFFVAVTSGLLYLLLKSWCNKLVDVPIAQDAAPRPFETARLLLLFIVLVLIVPLIGVAIITLYGPQIEREAYANLEAVARLKTEQIESWLDERQGDSKVLAANEGFARQLDQFMQQHTGSPSDAIQKWLNVLRNVHGYDSILLLDTKGQLLFTLGENPDMPTDLQKQLHLSLATKQVQQSDLYRDELANVHLDWVVPIFITDTTGEHAVAAVVLRITAQDFLFPLIQTWPTASPTAEMLLVCQNGESALFLNALRHRADTALLLNVPLTRPALPAAVAIRSGQPGITAGKDYRNIEVLAAFRPVKGTNWRLVAKVDRDEVLAPLRELVLWVSLVAFVAIVAISIALLLLLRQQQRSQNLALLAQKAKAEYELSIADLSLKESQNRTQSLVDNALDGVISMDQNGKVIGWNTQASHIFGYSLEQALGCKVAELIMPPIYREAHRQGLARFIKTGISTLINTRVELLGMRADGSEFPLELTIAAIKQRGEYFFSAYIRDLSERKQAELVSNQLKAMIDISLDGFWIVDLTGHLLQVNGAYAEISGYSIDELVNMHINQLDVTEGTGEIDAHIAKVIALGYDQFETRHRHKDGHIIDIDVSATFLPEFQKFCVFCRDITKRKQTENELRIAATTFESHEAMLITDASQTILRVNQAFTRITGYSAKEAMRSTPAILKSGRQDKQFYDVMWESLNLDKFWQGEIWNRRKSGELYPEWLRVSAVTDANGQVTNYVASFTDITAIKKSEEIIHNLAFYDPLTQLPNRRLLMDRLQQALNSSTRNLNHGAVLFVDLDNFKDLNDIKGPEMGDQLLVEVAKRLQICARANDTVACFGGDDFVLVLEELSSETDQAATQAESIAEKIRIAINQPFDLQGHKYVYTSSIGISLFRNHEVGLDDLLKQADTAMYQAKQSGRNTIRFFDPATHAAIEARIALEADLREALPNWEFRLYYQMQVDHTGKILGAEALIRWWHPRRGLVSPVQFIPLAEQSGLILQIGLWVLETACAQIKHWELNPNARHLQLAVNVSARQFRQPDFVRLVSGVLEKYAINPNRLKLELTETLVLEDVNDTIEKIQALKEIGLRFSMDDFGTGYSSLAYLSKLPLDQLKIDQSFVYNIGIKPSDAVIVQTIIGMAKNLGIEVIAEGVETEQQRDFLERNGCTHYQGYLFGKPVPLEVFEEQLLANSL